MGEARACRSLASERGTVPTGATGRSVRGLRAGRIGRGARWVGSGFVVGNGVRYLTLLGAAAALGAEGYGQLAMALAVTNVTEVVAGFGFRVAVVSNRPLSRKALAKLCVLSVVICMSTGFIVLISATWLSTWLKVPQAAALLRVAGIVAFIRGLTAIPEGILQKNRDFGTLAAITVGAECVVAGTVLLGIVRGDLTAQLVLFGMMMHASVRLLATGLGTLRFEVGEESDYRAVASFAARASGSEILNRGLGNVDYLLVGSFLGPRAAGAYALAFQLVITPGQYLANIVRRVALAEVGDGSGSVAGEVCGLCGTLWSLLLPLVGAWIVVAVSLGGVVFSALPSEGWNVSVLLLGLMGVVALVSSYDLMEVALLGIGRPGSVTVLSSLRLATYLGFAVVLIPRTGVNGAVASLIISWIVGEMTMAGYLSRRFSLKRALGSDGLSTAAKCMGMLLIVVLLGAMLQGVTQRRQLWASAKVGMSLLAVFLLWLSLDERTKDLMLRVGAGALGRASDAMGDGDAAVLQSLGPSELSAD